MTPADIIFYALLALAACLWLAPLLRDTFNKCHLPRVRIALRVGDVLLFSGRHMAALNVTAGVPATLVLVRTPDGAPVQNVVWKYDDNGANVGSFHPATDNLSGIFLGTGAGSATVSVACQSAGGVALSDAAQVTIAAAPPVEATAVSIQLAP